MKQPSSPLARALLMFVFAKLVLFVPVTFVSMEYFCVSAWSCATASEAVLFSRTRLSIGASNVASIAIGNAIQVTELTPLLYV